MAFNKSTIDIPSFYAHKTVLLTGATGFVGKVVLEKIMRSCPNFKRIYLMVRPKKSQSI
jgi:fatty acyl-CoA reductase